MEAEEGASEGKNMLGVRRYGRADVSITVGMVWIVVVFFDSWSSVIDILRLSVRLPS